MHIDLVLADRWYIDAARFLAIATGICIVAMALGLAYRDHRVGVRGDRDWALGTACWGIAVIAQESTQIGHGFLVWRLPLFLAGNIWILRGMTHRARANVNGPGRPPC